MTSALARYSAILSALLALLGVAAWVLQGAPDVVSLPRVWMTTSGELAVILHKSVPLFTRATLFIVAISAAFAALLALLTLLRGSGTGYVRYLGIGLGWWSLGFFVLLAAPALPSLTALALPLPFLVAGDVLGFLLMLGASLALQRFWTSFPREISLEELHAFIVKRERSSYPGLGSWRARLSRLVLGDRAPQFMESRVAASGRMQRRMLQNSLWPGRGAQLALLATAVAGGLLWRLAQILPQREADASFPIPFVIFGALLFLPGAHCLNILRMHRVRGTQAERRKIEWVWASFWIAIVLFVPVLALFALSFLDIVVFDAAGLDPAVVTGAIALLLLAPLCAPLCLLVALMVSIFYRGDVDPRLALRGITLWTLVGVLLTLVFALVERSVAVRLGALLGLPPQTGYVAAGAVVAATFQPIRKLAEKQVNRFVARVLPAAGRDETKPDKPKRKQRKRSARLRRRSAT